MKIRYGSPYYEWSTTIQSITLATEDSSCYYPEDKYVMNCIDSNGEEEMISLPANIESMLYGEDEEEYGHTVWESLSKYGSRFHRSLIVDDVEEFSCLLP